MEKEKKSEIHITNNFNAPIGQHIDHVDTINFRMDGEGSFHFGMVEHANAENKPESCVDAAKRGAMPDVLASEVAQGYWERLQAAGFTDAEHQLLPGVSRKQAMYIALSFAEKLNLTSKWKPFEQLWNKRNLAQEKWNMTETGIMPSRYEEIDRIFAD